MKILWLPHLPWARMEGQREWHLVKRLLARGHEIHVLTWEAIGELGALLRTLGSRTVHDGALTIHRAPRLPNPVGRITRDYSRGFPPNEWLFRRHVRRILADERIDLFVYGLSHKAVGLPPFDVAVPRVFDYLDLCLYPGVEDAYLANSDLVLCTSTVLVERVRARGVRAAYLPNGVDRGRLASGKAEAVRRALGLTGKRVVSLIGLTCSPTLFFVDAIARARREMPDIVFLAVGAAGWLPREGLSPFAARCRQLGVPLVATGPVPNAAVADYFDLEELRRFGWPNVFLEPPEPAAFAAGIVRAFSEHPPMPDLASFDWDVLAARFEESCEALLSERASTRAASAQVRRGEVLDERPVPSSPV
ncbi:MAG: glycosyltransferase family 4 protein [Chloroflexi bacterium]|nr:MAG: glycosyltransferase family 4 protein [Chloroflexota bacterium]